MKKLTKLIALALVLVMTITNVMAINVTPGLTNSTDIANYLYSKDLLRGKGYNSDGTPNFALNDTATRAEAVVMFVRVIGKEQEAINNTYEIPFTDVPEWVKPYVGYAYANGCVKGTGANKFSPEQQITEQEFVVLILRCLNYKENIDFTWDMALMFAESIGLLDFVPSEAAQRFTRGHMVTICYNCLIIKQNSNNNSNSNIPVTDVGPILANIVELDASDVNNLYPDGEGNYNVNIQFQPEGTAIVSDLLTYIPGASTDDNITNFVNAMTSLDTGIFFSGNTISYGGKNGPSIAVYNGMWDISVNYWGANFTKSGNDRQGSKYSRTLMLNTLRYFGDANMANAVYGMLDEHYRFRSDNTVPISDELAAKYGLTLLSHQVNGTVDIMVGTDMNSIWSIAYNLDNEIQDSSVTILIPIR